MDKLSEQLYTVTVVTKEVRKIKPHQTISQVNFWKQEKQNKANILDVWVKVKK